MIYCVVPRELADELFDKMVEYYKDNPNVTVIVDRREGPDRRKRGPREAGGKRETRDRRRPRIPGTFLEAEAGPPLAEIVALDPAVVAYEAPYADRLVALEATDAKTVEDLMASLRVTLRLPGGRLYAAEATPHAASADVDRATGAVTVWARFPNPNAILRPGMAVEVASRAVAGAAEPVN